MFDRLAFLGIGIIVGRLLAKAEFRNKQLEADLAAAKVSQSRNDK